MITRTLFVLFKHRRQSIALLGIVKSLFSSVRFIFRINLHLCDRLFKSAQRTVLCHNFFFFLVIVNKRNKKYYVIQDENEKFKKHLDNNTFRVNSGMYLLDVFQSFTIHGFRSIKYISLFVLMFYAVLFSTLQ